VAGEHRPDYEALLARIRATLAPADTLEEIWIRDVVDLVWETFRLRRIKAAIMTSGTSQVLECELKVHAEPAEVEAWERSDRTDGVPEALTSRGISLDMLMGDAIWGRLDRLERIDRMLVSAEARRSAALRELDHHRSALGQRLRLSIAQAEEAEARAQTQALASMPAQASA